MSAGYLAKTGMDRFATSVDVFELDAARNGQSVEILSGKARADPGCIEAVVPTHDQLPVPLDLDVFNVHGAIWIRLELNQQLIGSFTVKPDDGKITLRP